LLHLVMHSRLEHERSPDGSKKAAQKLSKLKLEAVCDSLKGLISRLKPACDSRSNWTDYYETCSYSETSMDAKEAGVKRFNEQALATIVLDVGATKGRFSRLDASAGAITVAMDYDHSCVDDMYCRSVKDGIKNLIPIVFDAANPSPAIGWALTERD